MDSRISYALKDISLLDVIHKVMQHPLDQAPLRYHCFDAKEENLLRYLYGTLSPTYAAGGKVLNEKGEYLFIKRSGKWDLPKGHVEEGESLYETAVREVEEETGITGVSITRYLTKTFHTYLYKDSYVLKVTHWFEMKAASAQQGAPQKEEGITKVTWRDADQIKKSLQNTYPNIKRLFSAHYYADN